MIDDILVIDCHTHLADKTYADRLISDVNAEGADRFCVLVGPRTTASSPPPPAEAALSLRDRYPGRVFVFGGIDHVAALSDKAAEADTLRGQIDNMMADGFNGLKLLAGKPTVRKELGRPLNGPYFKEMLTRLEETQFPVLWHVADPSEFWDPDAVPLWAKRRKWWYDDTYLSKEQIDSEFASVLAAHPRLNMVVPHFYFLSEDLEQAAEFLARNPTVRLDIAPGIELCHNLSRDPAASRAFMEAHSDRILFGTDTGLGGHFTHPGRGPMLRRWLETEDVFEVPPDPCFVPDTRTKLHGLGLSRKALKAIYADNFIAFVQSAART